MNQPYAQELDDACARPSIEDRLLRRNPCPWPKRPKFAAWRSKEPAVCSNNSRDEGPRGVILKGAVGKETESVALLSTELHDRFELRVPRADG